MLDQKSQSHTRVELYNTMLPLLRSLALIAALSGAAAGPPAGFEDAWRAAAAKFAAKIQPRMSDANKQRLLQGLAVVDPSPPLSKASAPITHPAAGQASFYVSPDKSACSDAGPGSEQQPLCTVQAAVSACRGGGGSSCAVVLRGGTHRLGATITLGPADSRLSVTPYPGERAVVTGAQELDSGTWTKVRTLSATTTLWRAPVADRPPSIDTLYTDGVRAIPARYPNADFELDKFPIGYVRGQGDWSAPADLGKSAYIEYNDSATFRPSYRSLFTDYRAGVGGQCSVYTPPFSYWCSETPQGGGASQFVVPSGLTCSAGTLPNAPYASLSGGRITAWRPGHWANWQFEIDGKPQLQPPPLLLRPASACTLFENSDATPGNDVKSKDGVDSAADCAAMCAADCDCDVGVWGSTGSGSHNCYLKSAKAKVVSVGKKQGNTAFNCTPCPPAPSLSFNFSKGGFQGGRGNANGAEWFVSHLPEELDFPREFWYNESEGALYFVSGTATIDCHNDPNCNTTRAQGDPASSTFEHATLKTLFELQGTQAAPVEGVTFRGLTFTGAAETFLDPHGVPSGGDWALQRSAALFFEGTTNTVLEDCELIRLDGNAVMLSGFNQHTMLTGNTFLSTGASAIALWGYSNGTHPLQPEGTGPDGTAGNFPRWTTVDKNFFRHLGIHEKQSSCLFQAKAAETTISNNICFDVPRAGFNLNDGFGGGHDIHSNLLFQTCGESGDHGAINTWDRQSFVTTVRDGKTPSIVPAETAIHHNFIVSDYDADGGMIDNDDGSSFYDEYDNFGVYGGAKFGNIDGHGKKSHGNVYAFPNVYGKSCFWHWPGWFPLAGYHEVFYNNTCIMDGAKQNYIKMPTDCSFANASTAASTVQLVAHDNKVFAPSANAVVSGCDNKALPFADWMKLGVDHGSTLAQLPSNDEIVAMGLAVLGMCDM